MNYTLIFWKTNSIVVFILRVHYFEVSTFVQNNTVTTKIGTITIKNKFEKNVYLKNNFYLPWYSK